jgi:L-fuculose-phosphate aldolase
MVEVGRLLYEKGLIASTEGNLSLRLAPDRILATPTGRCKGRLSPADLVTVSETGRRVAGGGAVSSEIPLHLAIYRARPDIAAVVHAHPPTATGFAVAGVPLADCVLPEILLSVGSVPLTPYGTPSTEDLCEKVLPTARKHDAFLLKNHGAVSLGGGLWEAFHRMEMVECFAKVLFTAKLLGRVEPLDPEEVNKLLQMRPAPPGSGCGNCATCTHGEAGSPEESLTDEIVRRVEERLRSG